MAQQFGELAKEEYEELKARKEQIMKEMTVIEKKLKPLEAYLKAAGIISEPEKPKRGRKPKEK
jgi:hypothetical protein